MSQYILQRNERIVPRRSVRPLTVSEINSPSKTKMREEFDMSIKEKLGDSITMIENPPDPDPSSDLEEFAKNVKFGEVIQWFVGHDVCKCLLGLADNHVVVVPLNDTRDLHLTMIIDCVDR